jgi:hypothetical protein
MSWWAGGRRLIRDSGSVFGSVSVERWVLHSSRAISCMMIPSWVRLLITNGIILVGFFLSTVVAQAPDPPPASAPDRALCYCIHVLLSAVRVDNFVGFPLSLLWLLARSMGVGGRTWHTQCVVQIAVRSCCMRFLMAHSLHITIWRSYFWILLSTQVWADYSVTYQIKVKEERRRRWRRSYQTASSC